MKEPEHKIAADGEIDDGSRGSRADRQGLDKRLQAHIGGQLKSMYDSYLNEPIPDRLVELLDRLDRVSLDDARDDTEKADR